MVWNVLIPAAAALIGGKMSSDASKSAASTSAAASDRASELQREMFERNVELQEPFRQSGLAAQNRLLTLLGLAPPEAPSGGGGVVGMIGNVAANALGRQQGPGLQVDRSSPDFGRYARDFSMADYEADPGYAFRMSEGMKGLERSAAARGGLLSGSILKGIQRFGQDLASQEYQNAFNRYQTNRAAQLNPLQSLAGVGQTTANTLGQAGTQFANTMGNIGMNQANVAGNAAMSRASAYGNTLNQLSYLGGRYFGGSGGGSPSNRDIERQYLGMD